MKINSIQNIVIMLRNSNCSIKWYNMGTWKKQRDKEDQKDIENLLDACKHYNIKIRNNSGNTIFNMKFSSLNVKYVSSFVYAERDALMLVKIACMYLGDKTTIKTRFGIDKINF